MTGTTNNKSFDGNEIIPGFWIGSMDATIDFAELKKRHITHIIALVKDRIVSFPKEIKYIEFDVYDKSFYFLLHLFPQCFEFIDEALKNKSSVLVHCSAGVSRSATLAIAYLMYSKTIPYSEAMAIVKKARPVINPNNGFIDQLQLFENMHYTFEGTSKAHHEYHNLCKLQRVFDTKKYYQDNQKVCMDELGLDPEIPGYKAKFTSTDDLLYRCSECKRKLFITDDIIVKNGHRYFIQPMQWMAAKIIESAGKLTCPCCGSILGGFNWFGAELQQAVNANGIYSVLPSFSLFKKIEATELLTL